PPPPPPPPPRLLPQGARRWVMKAFPVAPSLSCAPASVAVVHDIPGRLRLRVDLSDRLLRAIEEVAGVVSVRANPGCRSVVVCYQGTEGVRAEILKAVVRGAPTFLPSSSPLPTGGEPDPVRVVLTAGAWIGAWLLPPPWRAVLTWLNVADVLSRGLKVLLTEGIKVEVLDAVAIGLPALRGEFATTNFARFLLELGGWIEASTARRSDTLLEKLLHAEPEQVWIESTTDGRTIEVPYRTLKRGEWVVVGTGRLIPVDGVVVSGTATVNQASVTGESLPIPKTQGDTVLSGTVVHEGNLVVMAERVGAATTMARISRTIRESLDRPSQIQCQSRQMADRRVMITVLSGGAMVFALTRDWRRLESVFLVDYACAVKFGTPIALKAAMYRAARMGCLVKGGQAIENLAHVDTVIFDKTGTLTANTLDITDIVCLTPDMTEGDLLALVASLAEHTTHPIAAAVVTLARRRHFAHITHEEVDFIIGHGVASQVGGRRIRIGSRHYLEEDEGVSFAIGHERITRLQDEGKALMFISADSAPLGIIALRDRVRVEAAATLKRLR
ncbi:MAG: ATPase P, partial [Rhodospirillaceae bacterium]